MKILESELIVSINGTSCPNYRGGIKRGDMGAIIYIEQPINRKCPADGNWLGCGSWYLSTLLEGGVNDSLSIDYGQNWNIDSGLTNLVNEAVLYLASQFNIDE